MPTEPASAARRTARSQESLNDSLELDSSGIREVTESGVGLNHGFELREDPSFWKDHNVQVVIRIRPLSNSEISLQGQNRCVRQDSCQTLTWIGHPESRFTFDLVADEHVSQERLFNVAGVPMVENCMAGYNSCMFAYGQTGSGKTHTMLGDLEGGIQRNSVNCGMTPRVFEYLFSRIHKEKENQSCQKLHVTCRCSFLEIYNEQILDLLDPSSINLQLREDARRGVYVENLKEYEVSSPRDVIQQLIQGAANRKVAATNMNRASSRSHSVFTCVIERKWESQGVAHHRFARLNLVDLAGSERQKSSGAEGDRLKEATNINKSLSTLGLVIMNLVSTSGKRQLHVPYRDSKLTFLLQDSLGGNSKTMIIANISPSNCCSLETLSTLKFAQRAKFIRNNAIVNEEASGDVIAMRIQIQQLKKEVNRLKGLINGGPDNLESDSRIAYAQASPGILKWNGDQASFSPLTFDKRLSPREEHEAALVAALRRSHDKEEELKALEAEREAADKLVIHRTEEAKSLKLRLRFREDEIRRLKALASAKLSPETLFSQERDDLLKEVEVLRNQVDRNPEVTRFALENMQLREELRRLKSFVEDGERETMNEQLTVLQDKLLEALDWKLMHEKNTKDHPLLSWDSSVSEENEFLRLEAIQNQREAEALRKNLTFCLEVKENLERRVEELMSQVEEQMKAEDQRKPSQNQNLDAESNDQMELKTMIDAMAAASQREADAESHDQLELKTIVDAIAAASQREAEAHETAITLARENDELRMKLKVLIEDNENLIKLHEFDSAKAAVKSPGDVFPVESTQEIHEFASVKAAVNETCDVFPAESTRELHEFASVKVAVNETGDVFPAESTQEIHEFASVKAAVNETCDVFPAESTRELHEFASVKVAVNETGVVFPAESTLELHEFASVKATVNETGDVFPAESTREPHEFASVKAAVNATGGFFPAESTLELQNSFADFHGDGQEREHHDYLEDKVEKLEHQFNEILEENEKLMGLYEKAMQERDNFKRMLAAYEHARLEVRDEINCPEKLVEVDEGRIPQAQNAKEFIEEHGQHELPEEMLSAIRTKLDLIEDKFSPTWEVVNFFGLLEKAASELEATCCRCEDVDCNIISKQQEIIGLGLALSNLEDTRTVTCNKLFALKTALRNISSKFHYWEEREYRAKVRYESCLAPLDLKKEELRRLYVIKNETDTSCMHAKQSEIELRSNIDLLKVQLQAREAQRKESERVLFCIDNLDRNSLSEPSALNFGKASELLKSEEERTKIAVQIKKLREKLVTVQKELTTLHSISESLDTKIEKVEALIRSESALLQETELAWRRVSGEKLMICKMIEDGMIELGSILVEYHECLFGVDLKKGEILLLEEELQLEMKGKEKLRAMQKVAVENLHNLLEDYKNRSSMMIDSEDCSSMIDSEDCSNFASEKIEKQFRQALRSLTDVKRLLLSGGR